MSFQVSQSGAVNRHATLPFDFVSSDGFKPLGACGRLAKHGVDSLIVIGRKEELRQPRSAKQENIPRPVSRQQRSGVALDAKQEQQQSIMLQLLVKAKDSMVALCLVFVQQEGSPLQSNLL